MYINVKSFFFNLKNLIVESENMKKIGGKGYMRTQGLLLFTNSSLYFKSSRNLQMAVAVWQYFFCFKLVVFSQIHGIYIYIYIYTFVYDRLRSACGLKSTFTPQICIYWCHYFKSRSNSRVFSSGRPFQILSSMAELGHTAVTSLDVNLRKWETAIDLRTEYLF